MSVRQSRCEMTASKRCGNALASSIGPRAMENVGIESRILRNTVAS
jgi:hypothetical protein